MSIKKGQHGAAGGNQKGNSSTVRPKKSTRERTGRGGIRALSILLFRNHESAD